MSPIFDKIHVPQPESCDTLSGIEVFMARLKARRRSSRARALVLTDVRTPPSTLSRDSRTIRLHCFTSPLMTLARWPLLALVLCAVVSPAFGQTDVNDVH